MGKNIGGSYTGYVPYKMIFTDDTFFGENMHQKEIRLANGIISLLAPDTLFTFGNQITKETVIRDSGVYNNFTGSIDVKFNYKKVKKVIIGEPIFIAFSSGDKQKISDFMYLKFNMGFANTMSFVVRRKLLSEITELLNKTQLVGKIKLV